RGLVEGPLAGLPVRDIQVEPFKLENYIARFYAEPPAGKDDAEWRMTNDGESAEMSERARLVRPRLFVALVGRSAAQLRYVAAGSMLLAFGFQLVLVGQAASIQQSQSYGSVANLIPSFIGRALGSATLLLASFQGTVMLGYFHPLLVILIPVIAMYAATEPAHEVESGIVDLVLARSMPRAAVMTRSLAVAMTYALAAVVAMAAGTW